MKNVGKTLVCVVGCIAAALVARAGIKAPAGGDAKGGLASDNPYGAIVERNIFDLKEPVVTNLPASNAPPIGVKLNGITTILGRRQGVFMVTEPGGPGKTTKDHSYILSEGQRAGVLEVVEINPKARNARIKNDGVEATINIETNRVAPASGGSPNMGGAHMPPGAGGLQKGGNPTFNYPGGGNTLPVRPMRSEGASQPPVQPYAGGTQIPGGGMNLNPGGNGYSNPTTAAVQPTSQQPALTPEEQAILIEAQKAALEANGDIRSKMFPPTQLSGALPSAPPKP